jgi:hypothetical protein
MAQVSTLATHATYIPRTLLTSVRLDRSMTDSLQWADNLWTSRLLGALAIVLFMPNRWTFQLSQRLNTVLYDDDFQANGRASLEAQSRLVRSLVPAENLLEFNVKEGWDPLCWFLGNEVPKNLAFPHVNESAGFRGMIHRRHQEEAKTQAARVVSIVAHICLAWYVAGVVKHLLGVL